MNQQDYARLGRRQPLSLSGKAGAESRIRVRDGDEFTANLWDVHLRVKKEGYTQVRRLLGKFRCRVILTLPLSRISLLVYLDLITSFTKTCRKTRPSFRLSKLSSTQSPLPLVGSLSKPVCFTSSVPPSALSPRRSQLHLTCLKVSRDVGIPSSRAVDPPREPRAARERQCQGPRCRYASRI